MVDVNHMNESKRLRPPQCYQAQKRGTGEAGRRGKKREEGEGEGGRRRGKRGKEREAGGGEEKEGESNEL